MPATVLYNIGEKHFIIESTLPVRIEVSVTDNGDLLAYAYRFEDKPGEHAEPIGAFDSTIKNRSWTYVPELGLSHPSEWDEPQSQEVTVTFFVHDDKQWIVAAGELFGPYASYLQASTALVAIVRSLP
jgi:hypothetical protein